jgi:hypothetical protein
VDSSQNLDASKCMDILSSFDLKQNVREATHNKGQILDLIISCISDQIVDSISVKDTQISDHFWVHGSLLGPRPKTLKKSISYRKVKAIDTEQFTTDINTSKLAHAEFFDNVDEAVSTYNDELSNFLNKHAPVITRTITLHPEAPWYNPVIDAAKKDRRKAENRWRKSQLTIHRDLYVEKKQPVIDLLTSPKKNYYTEMIDKSADQKSLFKVVDKMTNKKSESVLPEHSTSQELANSFVEFFSEKIVKLRNRLDESRDPSPLPLNVMDDDQPTSSLDTLAPTTPSEVR